MKEIVSINIENDMDLALAHKRVVKLCELLGLSSIAQTLIATAVSEIGRCAIAPGEKAELRLAVETVGVKKYLRAIVRKNGLDLSDRWKDATAYARRLVKDVLISKSLKDTQIIISQQLINHLYLTDKNIDQLIGYFKMEPPLSPYDEIRRKNLLLVEFASKLQQSEKDFRLLTDSLPLMMFSAAKDGVVDYSNKWLRDFFGQPSLTLKAKDWESLVHDEDFKMFARLLDNSVSLQIPFSGEYRFKESNSGRYVWHLVSILPLKNETLVITKWIGCIVDINAQKEVEATLKDNKALKAAQKQLINSKEELEQKVIALNRSNYELEQFAYLASHDLQEPLRKILFFSSTFNEKYRNTFDKAGSLMLNSMSVAAGRMKELITDVLSYSEFQHNEMPFEQVDLNLLFAELINDFDHLIQQKAAHVTVGHFPVIRGNKIRLRQLFANLISNALKYSRVDPAPVITLSGTQTSDAIFIICRDNGIGFDQKYSEKIFGLFQRLHTKDEFPGTGIGLSVCKRIVEMHHGTISATSEPGISASFKVTLPIFREKQELRNAVI